MTGSDRDEKEPVGKQPPKEDEEEEEDVTTASVEKEASDPPHCLVFNNPSFKVWRCCFYGLMAYQVAINHFGPCTFQQ